MRVHVSPALHLALRSVIFTESSQIWLLTLATSNIDGLDDTFFLLLICAKIIFRHFPMKFRSWNSDLFEYSSSIVVSYRSWNSFVLSSTASSSLPHVTKEVSASPIMIPLHLLYVIARDQSEKEREISTSLGCAAHSVVCYRLLLLLSLFLATYFVFDPPLGLLFLICFSLHTMQARCVGLFSCSFYRLQLRFFACKYYSISDYQNVAPLDVFFSYLQSHWLILAFSVLIYAPFC